MNQRQQAAYLADALGITNAEAMLIVRKYAGMVSDGLAAYGEFKISGIGKLYSIVRTPRANYNPVTGEEDILPARTGIKFRQSINARKPC